MLSGDKETYGRVEDDMTEVSEEDSETGSELASMQWVPCRKDVYNRYEPTANIYKVWAMNLLRNSLSLKYLGLVVFVLQFVTPLLVFGYSRREMRIHDLDNTWTGMWKAYQVSNGTVFDFNTNETIHMDFPEWAWADANPTRVFARKLLGSFFMALIFLQNDKTLLRYDLESQRFRKYFPSVSVAGSLIDVAVSCWCVSMISIAMLPTFALNDTVMSMLLDAIGVLFVVNLDKFATSGLDYGYNTERFDEAVANKRNKYIMALGTGTIDFERLDIFITIFVAIVRVFNALNMAVQISVFIMFDMHLNEDLEKKMTATVPTVNLPGWLKIVGPSVLWWWLPLAIGGLFLCVAARTIDFLLGRWRAQKSLEKAREMKVWYGVDDFGARGFLFYAILRREDLRFQAAMEKMEMEEDERKNP